MPNYEPKARKGGYTNKRRRTNKFQKMTKKKRNQEKMAYVRSFKSKKN